VYEQSSTLSVNCQVTNASCGQCNGSATLTASGGTAPYTYSWPGGSLSNLCPGTYTGWVTDANGCTASYTVTLYDSTGLGLSCYGTDATCDSCNGSVSMMAFGGTPPYTYSWPGGGMTGLCPGSYIGTVTDANGCTATCWFYVASSLSRICDTTKIDTFHVDVDSVAFAGNKTALPNSKQLKQVQAFPNPFDAFVNLRFYSPVVGRAYVSVQNLTGNVLRQFNVPAVIGYNTFVFDGRQLAKGTYFIKITMGESQVVKVFRR
jgi:hypothetical protein